MRKDTSFTDRKLTREEFSAKYWKGGDPNYIYQYHTMDIEDGRDEREQLLINNIRALWNLLRDFNRMGIGLQFAEQVNATFDSPDDPVFHESDAVIGK